MNVLTKKGLLARKTFSCFQFIIFKYDIEGRAHVWSSQNILGESVLLLQHMGPWAQTLLLSLLACL